MKTITDQYGNTRRVRDDTIDARARTAPVPQGLSSPTSAMSNSVWASTFRNISPGTAKGAIYERTRADETDPTRGIAPAILTQLFGANYAGAATPQPARGVPGTFGIGNGDNFNGAWSGARPQQPQTRFQPTVGGAPVTRTGAGFVTATGTSATPNLPEAMDIRTNGAWSTWSPKQRRTYLQSQPAPATPTGTVVDPGVHQVFNKNTGFVNTQRIVAGGTNGSAAFDPGPMNGAERDRVEWKYAPKDSLGNHLPVRGFVSPATADRKRLYGWGS